MNSDALTREEILRIEKETEDRYGISSLILMENAGRAIADVLEEKFQKMEGKKFCIVTGKGNNGGDGFVAAEYLFNKGAEVKIASLYPFEEFTKASFTNYEILCKMKVKSLLFENGVLPKDMLGGSDAIIDALFGTGVRGCITGAPAKAIESINESEKFILCADIPSGLATDTGAVCGIAVKGDVTVSFGFAKKGFYINRGPEYCGRIVIADIGFPRFFKKRVKND